jgi:hypothetical protein
LTARDDEDGEGPGRGDISSGKEHLLARDTPASRASGEDPGWVSKMLGHTTLTMLMTRYYY